MGKARPRVTRYGTYTPKKTKDYEEQVAQAYLVAASQEEKIKIWDCVYTRIRKP